jgi:uncharacterized protein (TIGR00297 family)
MSAAGSSETKRQLVHISMGGFALLLRWLSWPQAIALAGSALLFNLFVLPRLARALYRPGDRAVGLHGIVYYPLSVLILLLLFPRRLDIVAAAWGILAAGDGVATLAGRAIDGTRWPWNPDKTVAGSAAFVLAATIAGAALALWCRDVTSVPMMFAVIAVPIAAVTAALVETIPVKLDDNLSVALSAGGVLWLVAMIVARHASYDAGPYMESEYLAIALPSIRFGIAAAVNAMVAVAGYKARTVNAAGAICGAVIGTAIFGSLGWGAWLLLLVTFICASIASRIGLDRKQRLGIAEERGGRRGPGNAIANTGVAAIAAVLAGLDVHAPASQLAFVAALVGGGSDTVASEIGRAFGRRTWSMTSLRRVPAGTSGAMSLEGTLAGLGGAIGLSGAATAFGLLPASLIAIVVIAATVGSLVESWLGATLEAPGILNNDLLNFINTATAAGAAVVLAAGLS